jgi:ABC-2 type transport system ATP-binding protein
VVAEGAASEIEARVGLRTIRATLPAHFDATLASLPGVIAAERRGDSISLACNDSDRAIRAFVEAYPEARDIEIAGVGLEAALLELTHAEAA